MGAALESRPASSFALRVYYEDTDAGGIVYYANYLKFVERARTEWLRAEAGAAYDELLAVGGGFVVARAVVDYHAPARLHDLLTVETRPMSCGGASVVLEQKIRRDAHALATIHVTLVTVGRDGRPVRLPSAFADLFGTARQS